MSNTEILATIRQILADLETISFVAHRDTAAALPAIEPYGEVATLAWMQACQKLFSHDRDAGKSFIRGSTTAAAAAHTVIPWTEQALRFTQWRGSWKALEGFMRELPQAYAQLGSDGEIRWAEIGLAWCARHLDSGIAYFRTDVATLTGGGAVAAIEALLAPADELFKRRLALGSYLHGAIRVRDLLGAQAVGPWAQRGADIMQAGRLRGEAFFRLETPESVSVLLENMPGFRLPEHRRLLQLITAVWFDETFDLEESDWSPDRGRAFIETDAQALYLPAALPSRDEALTAVIHAAGHLVFHSYERRYIEALFREVGREHPPLDERQRITWRPLFAHYGDDLLRFQLLFDICEDLRVDTAIQTRVPNHLQRLLQLAEATTPTTSPARAYYVFARDTVAGALGSMPLDARLVPLLKPEATIVDAFRVANTLYKDSSLPPIPEARFRAACYLPARAPNAARPVYPRTKLDDAEFGTGTFDRDDIVRKEAIEPNPERREIPKAAQGDDPDFDIPPEDTSGTGGRVGVGIPQPANVIGYARGHAKSEQGVAYHEWDYRDRQFKRNWAFVQEKALDEYDASEAAKLLAQHAPTLQRLKRAIQSQKPTRPAPQRRQLDGDDLDIEATIQYIAEKRAGLSPKPTLYKRRIFKQRDTACLLLADISTSIMAKASEGEGRVVDRLRAAILLFAESLEEVGDPYAVAAFASKYRDNVSYYPIKEFDQRLNSRARALIGGLSGRLATRMGAAVRHAVKRFGASPSQQKLLMILSDGRPADYDDGGDEKYLHEDTRMAVKEAVDRGVHPFCVTLDPAGAEYLPQIFGVGHYMVIDRVNRLPEKLPEIYLRLRR